MRVAALALATLVGIAAACGGSTLVECRARAVSALPLDDPDAISVGHARELARALKACAPAADADAGR